MTDQPDMTVQEIAEAAQDLANKCGHYHASAFVTSNGNACLIVDNKAFKIDAEGKTWREAFQEAHRQLKQLAANHAYEVVGKMASAIIRIQHNNGECRFYKLIEDGFTHAEVEAHGEAACKLASEMTNGSAFEIIKSDNVHAA
ncbi:hypothetical protein [uncultured Tateyamaria sp.]|uniref:hypothetical protein n=1 Tax=uncultured Tateyamaria sp. TaxID=455651 RepID=UPI00260BD1F7|nr:hypothetical protein [uncultured Tateyamaria sp.]